MPFFRKPFKLYAIDADTGKPLDPNVRRKTYVTYYEVKKDGNGSKSLVAHKTASEIRAAADGKGKAKVTIEDVKKDNGGEKKGGAAEGGKKEVAGGGKSATEPFTKEEDEKLRTMKGENKSWKDIAAEMGRAQYQLKARWKEIEGAPKGDEGKKDQKGGDGNQQKNQNKKGDKGDNAGKKNKENKSKNSNHAATNDKKNHKQDQKAPPPAKKASSSANNKPSANVDDAHFTMADWQTLQEDSLFSFGELQCLSEIIAKDSQQGWQRVASKFFDLTGRRVHPEDVREKFEGLAAFV